MNDRFFWLFLGMTIFAVFYAVFMGYIFYQDSKHKIVRSKRGNVLVIFLALALVISISAIGYLFVQNRQLQNQKVQPVPPVQNSQPTNNFPTTVPVSTPAPVIDPTANWKNYNLGLVSINFPSEWIVTQSKFLPEDPDAYVIRFTINSSDYKYTDNKIGLAGGTLDQGMALTITGINMSKLVRLHPEQPNFHTKIEDDLKFLNDPNNVNNPYTTFSEIAVSNINGYTFIKYLSTPKDNTNMYPVNTAITYINGYQFTLSFIFRQNEKVKAENIFDQILSTFKFL